MVLIKCENCKKCFPEDKIEGHRLYCFFTPNKSDYDNLIPCEFCNELINIDEYNDHVNFCYLIESSTNNSITNNSITNNSITNNSITNNSITNNTITLLNFINDIDNIINELEGNNYESLINLDNNNVNVGIKNFDKIIEKKKEKIICPICTEECIDIGETKCKHKFCLECINEWLKTNKKCPICMIELEE